MKGSYLLLLLCLCGSTTNSWSLRGLKWRPKSLTSRGFDDKYGTFNNSTIPTGDEVAAHMGLPPFTRAPNLVWKLAWRGHGRLLPLLHYKDSAQAKDADQSLKVVWNKAIASLNKKSPAFDDMWTYSLLPKYSRWLLRIIPNRLFPRLHHANIEIRTAYLNESIKKVIGALEIGTKIRVVALGSGYDARYARLLTTGVVDEAWELDMEGVVNSKRKMLERVKSRLDNVILPELCPVDFNDIDGFRSILERIQAKDTVAANENWHTIFVSEGVLIYLDKGIPLRVLQLCKGIVPTSTFCFADLIREVEKGNRTQAEEELRAIGWTLSDWLPKPGLARHMGICV